MKRRMLSALIAVLAFSLTLGIAGCGSKDDAGENGTTVSEARAEQEELDKIREALEDDDEIVKQSEEDDDDLGLFDDDDEEDEDKDSEDGEDGEDGDEEDDEEEPKVETIKWGIVRKQYQQLESEAAETIGQLDAVDGNFVMRQVEAIYSKVDYLEVGITSGTDGFARDAYLAACKLEYLGVKGDGISDSVPVKLGTTTKEMIKLCYGEGDGDFEKLQKKVKAYIEAMYKFNQEDWDEFKSHF